MKRSKIVASRLRGDLGPLGNDPRTGLAGRIIAPAVALTGTDQSYEELSTTKNYKIGSRMQLDERVFYYGRAGGTLIPDLGVAFAYPQAIAYAAVTDALVGAVDIVVTVGATDGAAGDGAIAADELEGGWIVIFHNGVSKRELRKITGNTVVASGGGACTISVDRPLVLALSSDHAEAMHSMYYDIQNINRSYRPTVGVVQQVATVGQYLWVQTWGPIWASPQAEVGVGVLNRQCIFREDGSLDELTYDDATYGCKAQRAGFVMSNAQDNSQGAPFVFLQITP